MKSLSCLNGLTRWPALLVGVVLAGSVQAAGPLLLCYEDVDQPPWTRQTEGGLAQGLLREVEKQLDEQFILQAKPWKRCLEELRAGVVDAVIGAAATPERAQFGHFPLRADGRVDTEARLFEDRFHIYVRANSTVTWDGRRFSGLHRRVAIPSAYYMLDEMQRMQLRLDVSSKSADDALKLLVADLVDATVLEGDAVMQHIRQDGRFARQVRVLPKPFSTQALYLFVSQQRYQQSPERIKAIWRAITKQRHTASYQKRVAAALQVRQP